MEGWLAENISGYFLNIISSSVVIMKDRSSSDSYNIGSGRSQSRKAKNSSILFV